MKNKIPNLGVDGCRAGWISVQSGDLHEWTVELFTSIQDLWKAHHNSKLILIDIPIGIKDRGKAPRLNDSLARKYLTGKRSSSIFPTPCRGALYASTYEEANKINKNMTGKGLSKQSWYICSKIREVDILLQNEAKARDIIIESAPELCYFTINNNQPLKYYKKTKEGIKERLSILKSFCNCESTPLDIGLSQFKRKDVAIDDIMDAWILAIRAFKGISDLKIIPEQVEHDSMGLPMRIAF